MRPALLPLAAAALLGAGCDVLDARHDLVAVSGEPYPPVESLVVQSARKRNGKSMSEKLAAEFVDAITTNNTCSCRDHRLHQGRRIQMAQAYATSCPAENNRYITTNGSRASGASSADYGIQHNSSIAGPFVLDVIGSTVTASGYTISDIGTDVVSRIAGSQLSGGPSQGANRTCAGVWDEALVFYPSTCP